MVVAKAKMAKPMILETTMTIYERKKGRKPLVYMKMTATAAQFAATIQEFYLTESQLLALRSKASERNFCK